MKKPVQVHAEPDAIVVHIPLKIRRHGSRGRKRMVASADKRVRRHPYGTVLKALGRAYRWKRMLESGEFTSITDLATAERINHAYVRRILRLTLLSPEITEVILDGALSRDFHLERLVVFPESWIEQDRQLR